MCGHTLKTAMASPLSQKIVFFLLLPLILGGRLPQPGCYKQPADMASIIEEFQSNTKHESLNNLPGLWFGLPIAPDDIDLTFVNIIKLYFDGFETCPPRPNGTIAHLNYRSTCPVRWVMNFDQNRIPRDVVEAECSCKNCLEFSPDGRQTQNVCQPVYNHVNALRRVGCDGEYYQYARVLEKIKVGCTCAHPYVQVSGGSNPNGPTPST